MAAGTNGTQQAHGREYGTGGEAHGTSGSSVGSAGTREYGAGIGAVKRPGYVRILGAGGGAPSARSPRLGALP